MTPTAEQFLTRIKTLLDEFNETSVPLEDAIVVFSLLRREIGIHLSNIAMDYEQGISHTPPLPSASRPEIERQVDRASAGIDYNLPDEVIEHLQQRAEVPASADGGMSFNALLLRFPKDAVLNACRGGPQLERACEIVYAEVDVEELDSETVNMLVQKTAVMLPGKLP